MNRTSYRLQIAALIGALLLLASGLSALDLTVEYVDGYLDLKDGDQWVELFVGDPVPDTGTVKLGTNSIAEFSAPGVKLTLTRPGVYELGNLVDASGEQRSSGLASIVGNKVASLFSEKQVDSQAAVMGVRGAKSESEIQWMTGDTAELLATGQERLEEQDLDAALDLFLEAYDYAEMDEETEVLFYLGYTSYLLGDLAGAAGYFGDIIEVDTEAEFFPNLLLVNAQVLIETFAFQEAVDWLSEYQNADTVNESVRQTALLLEGVGHKSLGATGKAKQALEASRSIDPDTEIAKAAENFLSQLE